MPGLHPVHQLERLREGHHTTLPEPVFYHLDFIRMAKLHDQEVEVPQFLRGDMPSLVGFEVLRVPHGREHVPASLAQLPVSVPVGHHDTTISR